MDMVMIAVCIISIVAVACFKMNADKRVEVWRKKAYEMTGKYENMYETNLMHKKEIDRLNSIANDLRWRISNLEEKLELEKKYNKKANDSYIAKTTEKTTNLKEEINNLKKSKPISRSKAVQYITQHSNFTPTQMNNQTTDNLLDYYWYLYLMNTFTEDNKETKVDNVWDTAQQKADDLYEQSNASSSKTTESATENNGSNNSFAPDDSWGSSSGYNGYTHNRNSSSSSDSSSDSNSSSSWGYSSNDSSYSSGSSSSYSDYSSSSSDSSSDSGSFD